jgi:hypothetical protein
VGVCVEVCWGRGVGVWLGGAVGLRLLGGLLDCGVGVVVALPCSPA